MKLPALKVEFSEECLTTDFIMEALPMLAAHWAEIAHYKDIPLDPELDSYYSIQKNKALRLYTYRRAGLLKGYGIFLVRMNPHYKTSLQAQQDIFYVDPSERGITSIKFIRFCDEKLRAEGVQVVYHHVKAAHNFGLVLQRQGYELVDLIYAKRLD